MKYYDEPWGVERENLPSIDEFDPDNNYNSYELDRFADTILWNQILDLPNYEEPVILMHEHLHERRKKEIYVASGTPDETLTNDLSPDDQMIYWRTHPKGRKRNSGQKASFYR